MKEINSLSQFYSNVEKFKNYVDKIYCSKTEIKDLVIDIKIKDYNIKL